MATVTLSIPSELKKKMSEYPEVNWAEVFRRIIIRKVKQLQRFEQMVKRGEL